MCLYDALPLLVGEDAPNFITLNNDVVEVFIFYDVVAGRLVLNFRAFLLMLYLLVLRDVLEHFKHIRRVCVRVSQFKFHGLLDWLWLMLLARRILGEIPHHLLLEKVHGASIIIIRHSELLLIAINKAGC
jgi:hypothetical protein